MRSFDLREEFGFTQIGSLVKGKSASGLSTINSQEGEIREKRGKDQPLML